MNNLPTKNKVKFVHFNGYESEWQNKIDNSVWVNSIVFGKVWDESLKCNMKIYAGKDSIDKKDYVYDMASLQLVVEVEKKVTGIQAFLALDASKHFDNSTMKFALEAFIANDSSTVTDIQNYIRDLLDVVATHEDRLNDLDISVNLINTTLEETIHWLDEYGWIDPE